jgi:TrmH family RNA methyltransferase
MLPTICKIVLVRPRNPNNIGAVARAMKNFGLTDLCIVSPYPPVWDEVISAVNAADLLNRAGIVQSLDEAIADCNLAVGTTDPTRVEKRRVIYTPVDLSVELRKADYRLALIFGSEKHGLTREDLSRCHRVMSIPTRSDCPSMNLGQAVAVCCYELMREEASNTALPLEEAGAATAGAIDAALKLSIDVLQRIDYVVPGREGDLTLKIRKLLLRLNLTGDDVGVLCGVLNRIKRGLEK